MSRHRIRPVETPEGVFPTYHEAAFRFRLKPQTAYERARHSRMGWRFLSESAATSPKGQGPSQVINDALAAALPEVAEIYREGSRSLISLANDLDTSEGTLRDRLKKAFPGIIRENRSSRVKSDTELG